MKDLARIYIKAGDGGDGSAHFLHGKYTPKGGPDGGDGGSGGDIILEADENVANLVEFNYTKRFVVKNAERGMEKKMHGKDTEDMVIKVPVGTVVYEIAEDYAGADLRKRERLDEVLEKRRMMVDMKEHGQRFEAAWGGRGGRGNWHFRSPTNQAPKEFEKGKPGDEKWLLLEMKVVADVGIVGLPNVGKSSLLKSLTKAQPKIAGYPFTTLEPNLGVVHIDKGDLVKNVILVDVPGVIEDAWEGKGIGPWFLRHLERTKTLLHVLAPSCSLAESQCHSATEPQSHSVTGSQCHNVTKQLIEDYKIVRKELEKYGKGLPEKKEVVVINKMELVAVGDRMEIETGFKKETGKDVVWVSAGMGEVAAILECL